MTPPEPAPAGDLTAQPAPATAAASRPAAATVADPPRCSTGGSGSGWPTRTGATGGHLQCDAVVPGAGRAFSRRAGGWELRVPRPALARLEYQLGVVDQCGRTSTEVDPANPVRVDTAFGTEVGAGAARLRSRRGG